MRKVFNRARKAKLLNGGKKGGGRTATHSRTTTGRFPSLKLDTNAEASPTPDQGKWRRATMSTGRARIYTESDEGLVVSYIEEALETKETVIAAFTDKEELSIVPLGKPSSSRHE